MIEGNSILLEDWDGSCRDIASVLKSRDLPFEISLPEYLLQSQAFVDEIQQGKLSKAILSRVVTQDVTGCDIALLFNTMCDKYPTASVFCYSTSVTGLWMGATPELFFEKSDNQCYTVALAGTRKGNDNTSWQQKELHEQALVARFIEDVLHKHQAQNIEESQPQTVQAGAISHLRTSFGFTLRDGDPLDQLLLDLHPTPAVCGLSKDAAMALINRIEKHDRRYYGGFNGYVSGDDFLLFVTLRCMQIVGQKACLYVGGGITAASVPQSEWDETVLKSQTLLSVLKNI
jgi:isochorismate synthase